MIFLYYLSYLRLPIDGFVVYDLIVDGSFLITLVWFVPLAGGILLLFLSSKKRALIGVLIVIGMIAFVYAPVANLNTSGQYSILGTPVTAPCKQEGLGFGGCSCAAQFSLSVLFFWPAGIYSRIMGYYIFQGCP
jgi:hypothetical protein